MYTNLWHITYNHYQTEVIDQKFQNVFVGSVTPICLQTIIEGHERMPNFLGLGYFAFHHQTWRVENDAINYNYSVYVHTYINY